MCVVFQAVAIYKFVISHFGKNCHFFFHWKEINGGEGLAGLLKSTVLPSDAMKFHPLYHRKVGRISGG